MCGGKEATFSTVGVQARHEPGWVETICSAPVALSGWSARQTINTRKGGEGAPLPVIDTDTPSPGFSISKERDVRE